MKPRLLVLVLALALSVLLVPTKLVHADGIIIPQPCPLQRCPPPPPCLDFCPPVPVRPIERLEIKYHHVEVTISDQLATTQVDQVFHNPNGYAVEGTYIFPLPQDAVATGLKLWVDGQAVEGKLLNADEARKVYQDTMASLRDPALLEYAGRGAFKASIFPIPAGGDRRIQIEYAQVLKAENGLVRYTYPLNTEKFSLKPLEDVSIKVDLNDQNGLRVVYSPSHSVDITRDGLNHALVGYEARNTLPDQDFTLYFSTGGATALHLLTYRDPLDPQDADGYFLMLVAPGAAADHKPVAKDVFLILDRSGSMEGAKFGQAQTALRYILNHLNGEDRFYLETFSTGVQTFAPSLQSTDEVPNALRWVDQLGASGSTDINRALLEAVAAVQPGRPAYLIFLTDGLPTAGVVDVAQIQDNFLRAAPDNLRLFAFGLGYDVNTDLLDSLSADHHGESIYVRPGDALDETLSAFYEKISQPVLTDLSLDFGGMSVYDVYPQPLPDLFGGSQVLVAGRYKSGGSADLALKGRVGEDSVVLRFNGQTFAKDSRSADAQLADIARIWASRKIGNLLNDIRLHGPDKETIDQIVRLSVRFGIVTPYTSYLVTEANPLGAQSQQQIAADALAAATGTPLPAVGESAVNRAAQEGALKGAGSAPQAPSVEQQQQGNAIRLVGARTFVLIGGVWTDTLFDPQKMTAQDLPFLSDAYYRLAQARPDVAEALALGDNLILVVDGKAYRVSGGSSGTVQGAVQTVVAPTLAPEPGQITVTPILLDSKVAPDGSSAGRSFVQQALPLGMILLVLGLAGLAIYVLRRTG